MSRNKKAPVRRLFWNYYINDHSFIICMPRDTLNANKTNCPNDIPMKNGMIELALIGSKLKIV